MTFLLEATRPQALKAAWGKVARGKLGRPGSFRQLADGHSLRSFSLRADEEIENIARRLRYGKYRYSSLEPFFVPKTNGKLRIICAPTIADRVVQRSMLDVLSQKQRWMRNPVSYGFVSERGVQLAAEKAVEYRSAKPWVFKTDITKFFDCVDRPLLKQKIIQQVRQKSLHPLLLAAVDCEVAETNDSQATRIRKQGIRKGMGVRQGMPLSPFFANLFLADFDRECVRRNISALRYADDLIFFAESEKDAVSLSDFCVAELKRIDLEVPALSDGGKTQIYSPDETAEFLGVELARGSASQYVVRLGEKQMEEIKSTIYGLGSLKELRQRGLDATKFGNSIASRAAAYSAAYDFCANAQELEASLRDWAKAAKIKVASALGIHIPSLDSDGRWFLGID